MTLLVPVLIHEQLRRVWRVRDGQKNGLIEVELALHEPDARFARPLSCAQQLIGGLEVHDRWTALLSL